MLRALQIWLQVRVRVGVRDGDDGVRGVMGMHSVGVETACKEMLGTGCGVGVCKLKAR